MMKYEYGGTVTNGTIGKFTLNNEGGFYAKGGASVGDKNFGYTASITEGDSQTYDLGQFGVPDGSTVSFYVDVVGGKNHRASKETFIYQAGSSAAASYTVSGTSLNNNLNYGGLSNN